MEKKKIVVTSLCEPAKFIEIGPTSWVIRPLEVPSDFLYQVAEDTLPNIEIGGKWDGDKLRVTHLSLNLDSGLTATHLIRVKLPEIVHAVAVHSVRDSELWTDKKIFEQFPMQGKEEQYSRVAQLYWFHHLSWGAPRQVIMDFMGWSRNNTNFHLKQISQVIGLPASRDLASARQFRTQKQ